MEKKELTFNLRFSEIKLIKYSQFDIEKEFDTEAKGLIEFQSNFNFKILFKEEKIVCIVDVKLVINETKEEFAQIKVENYFNVDPFKEVIKEKSPNNYDIPNPLLHNLVLLSISTVRGIMSEKLKGTIAQREVYPLINIDNLFKNKN
jgi:hypothetical protein